MTAIVKGRDLRANVKYITINGERLKMVFSNWAYMMVEDLYEEEFGKDIGFEAVLKEATKGKLKAVTALTYCALKAGGNVLPEFTEFAQGFDLEAMATITGEVMEGVKDSLPEPDEDDGKNA